MNILVTGANGQLAKCVADVVNSNEHKHQYYFATKEQLDITIEEEVEKYVTANDIKLIVNCAAFTDVDGCEEKNTGTAFHVNTLAPLYLANVMKRHNGMLVHISTDYVYTSDERWHGEPFREWYADSLCDINHRPTSIYGLTKYLGESAVIDTQCECIIIRTSWLYSKYGKNFFTKILDKLKEHQTKVEQFKVVSDQIGTPTWAPGLAKFIVTEICEKYDELEDIYKHYTINYSDEGSCSWYDFANAIQKLTAEYRHYPFESVIYPCQTSDFPRVAKRPKYSVMSHETIKRLYPQYKLSWWQDNLERCIKDYYAPSE